ncbi:MAG: hypothetical protein OXI23_01290 [Gemmatimonadota bacterium]|nr:hypothetical protein [Gemmatimonadota bacterium]
MANDKRPLLSEAESTAQSASVAGWFFLGFFLGLIGLLIVYLRSPKTPIRLSASWEGDDRYLFEQAYNETLKAKQVKATWWGFLVVCGLSLCWLLFWLLLAFSAASI